MSLKSPWIARGALALTATLTALSCAQTRRNYGDGDPSDSTLHQPVPVTSPDTEVPEKPGPSAMEGPAPAGTASLPSVPSPMSDREPGDAAGGGPSPTGVDPDGGNGTGQATTDETATDDDTDDHIDDGLDDPPDASADDPVESVTDEPAIDDTASDDALTDDALTDDTLTDDTLTGDTSPPDASLDDATDDVILSSGPGIGDPCGPNGSCAEGRCQAAANGESICCAASCDAACKSCSLDGTSCVDEVDDPLCGVVQCPADNSCRKYIEASVSTERCQQGTCGSPAQLCDFLPRGQGESCSATHLCDAAGNCNVPKFGLGAACASDSACTSGFCVDGVCCESACSTPCMDCRPGTGTCDVAPLDDVACPDIDCSHNETECSNSFGDITENRCKRLGACKDSSECEVSVEPQGTPCGNPPDICDGEGACGNRAVECGASSCGTSYQSMCCLVSTHPEADPPSCIDRSEPCLQQFGDWALGCDEHADCRTGEEICCVIHTTSGAMTQCTPPSGCNVQVPGAGASVVEMCESPVMPKQPCSLGTACGVTAEELPGFTFCYLP